MIITSSVFLPSLIALSARQRSHFWPSSFSDMMTADGGSGADDFGLKAGERFPGGGGVRALRHGATSWTGGENVHGFVTLLLVENKCI